jgi:hypothetical protein
MEKIDKKPAKGLEVITDSVIYFIYATVVIQYSHSSMRTSTLWSMTAPLKKMYLLSSEDTVHPDDSEALQYIAWKTVQERSLFKNAQLYCIGVGRDSSLP